MLGGVKSRPQAARCRKVIVVGDSLFAETLTRTLKSAPSVRVVGSAPTAQAALPLIDSWHPDAIIVAGHGDSSTQTCGQVLAAHPDVPLICADPGLDRVQVITSQPIGTRTTDLLAAVAGLPRRT